jgi:hypothetical protein
MIKCLLCDGEIDEEHPNDHLRHHSITSQQEFKYILALQKKVEDIERKLQKAHGPDI